MLYDINIQSDRHTCFFVEYSIFVYLLFSATCIFSANTENITTDKSRICDLNIILFQITLSWQTCIDINLYMKIDISIIMYKVITE